ncbi:poly(ethylene terephthalate) hydrolase family protein [Nocardia suismassiliense]|uniref:poly(ethylene terephthalate) hydrolase family protein n=1 Tax=Nocardia suismassiliense TaxID=2077092 RepID=UPI000D1FA31B|nr:alpha/beta hydrolase [Nocardia suismassiliense]
MNRTVRSGPELPRTTTRAALASIALLACVSIAAPPVAAAPSYQPAAQLEAAYYPPGPWAVAERTGLDCCTATGDSYDIWYPADLGAGGVAHPIITWGNGTSAHPREYAYLLAHLASWGFVVIAADRTDTGTGGQMLDAVEYLTRQHSNPDSIFAGKLDTRSAGAMGHSQGGLGAFNALARGGVSTAVTLEMPLSAACTTLPLVDGRSACIDPAAVTTGSVLLLNGSADGISPATQPLPPALIGMQSMQAYYDALPAGLPKARAALVGAQHNDIQGQPDCTNYSCTEGVYRYLGYLTAWFMDRLRGDQAARQAFLADTGELLHNPHWSDQASTITR